MNAQKRASTVLCALLAATGCQSAPDDLREWKPSDHQHTSESGAQKKGQTSGDQQPNPLGLDAVTLSTWQNNCISCHGKLGRGDGPQAFLYKPRDLTDPTWQSTVTDAQLLDAIQKGKGKMPGFALPDATALGLVKLVRLLGNLGKRHAAAGTSASAQPTATAERADVPTAATTEPHAAPSGERRAATETSPTSPSPAPTATTP